MIRGGVARCPSNYDSAPLRATAEGGTARKRFAYSAFSSSVTAPTDFLASPNSMEVWSA